jgi:hypothetical protein
MSSNSGSGTRDERVGEIEFIPLEGEPLYAGFMRYVSSFRMKDGTGVFDPRQGLPNAGHRSAHHLIHFIIDGPASGFLSGAYRERLPAADPFPTQLIWWTSSGKTTKILEVNVTRDTNKKVLQEEWKCYDEAGTLVETVTDVITDSGAFELTRTRTITP